MVRMTQSASFQIIISGSCYHGQVQLVRGPSPKIGILEICINDTWGAVCADSWTTNNTEVVCTQLGYFRGDMLYTTVILFILQLLGRESKWPFHSSRKGLVEVQCDGDERSVLNCSVNTTRRNDCLQEIVVNCYGKLLGYAIKGGQAHP